jgi:predicted PurR-regulated permease PerM
MAASPKPNIPTTPMPWPLRWLRAKLRRYGVLIALLGAVVLFGWLFSNIALFGLISLLLALLLRPIMQWLQGRRVGGRYFPKSLCALITLLALLVVLAGIVWLFVPLIVQEANTLTQTNPSKIIAHYEEYARHLEDITSEYGLTFNTDSLKQSLMTYRDEIIPQPDELVSVAGGIIGIAGRVAFGLFTVLFFTFFLLMDNKLVPHWLMRTTPKEYNRPLVRIYKRVKLMLRRYFAGLLLEFVVFGTLVFVGLSIFGIENAFFIAVIAGILNWIPYIGPLAGFAVGLIVTVLGNLTASPDNLGIMALKLAATIGVVQLIDAMFVQPTIFAKSVRAHPLEIFIVILMSAQIVGIPFMILAVPMYTVLRIVMVEVAPRNAVVAKLTEDMRESWVEEKPPVVE